MEITEIIKQQYGISKLPENPVEAMAYVPFQPENAKTYSPAQGFASGTMFPSLDKPFYGSKCGGKNDRT